MCSYENFTYGKKIKRQRRKLANLHENMRFKGGPNDPDYKRKIFGTNENQYASKAAKIMKEIQAKLSGNKLTKELQKARKGRKSNNKNE